MSGQQSAGAAQILEFASRLASDGFPGGPSRVELLLGRYPDDLSVKLPEFPGGVLLGTATHRRGNQVVVVEAIIDAGFPPREALTRYDNILLASAWEMAREHGPGGPPGFLIAHVGHWRSYRQDQGDPVLTVNALDLPDRGTTDLRLRLQWGMPRNLPPPAHPEIDLMPPLIPPPDVTLRPAGGSGMGDGWTVAASTDSDKPPAELENYFGAQLQALGWTRVGREESEKAAWSSWTRPDGNNPRAVLVVAAAFAAERLLLLHVERRRSEEDQWRSSRQWRAVY